MNNLIIDSSLKEPLNKINFLSIFPLYYEEVEKNTKNVSEKEKTETKNAIYQIKCIKEILDKYIEQIYSVSIENFSFQSKGSSVSRLYGSQYLLRNYLFQNFSQDSIHFFTPKEVKKIAGNGNWNKEQMIETFFNENDLSINNIKESLKCLIKINKRGKKVYLKPLDDIVDSYYINKLHLKRINNE